MNFPIKEIFNKPGQKKRLCHSFSQTYHDGLSQLHKILEVTTWTLDYSGNFL